MRVEKLELPEHLRSEIAPLLALLKPLNAHIEELDEAISERARENERAKRLMTVPQIGALTAVAFVATLDEAGRFESAHQMEAYLGVGVAGVELERGATAGPHHQGGPLTHAVRCGEPRERKAADSSAPSWRSPGPPQRGGLPVLLDSGTKHVGS